MLLKLTEYYNLSEDKKSYKNSSIFYLNTDNIGCIQESSVRGCWIVHVNNTNRAWVIDDMGMIDIKNALGGSICR